MLDVVIRNAHIIDGTGTPGWTGEIGLEGDKIAALGVVDCEGRREIDAGGQVV
ncbi:MAG: D-aminoacylase, partial [Gemmatimonadetes bacterium]|nr:D-aminoacylase [Gemmatimonadota bacterium]